MQDKISQGIHIGVETFYQPEYSNPLNRECMFAYRITITNNNLFPVQLLRRHWFIFDSGTSATREVQGDGVVGIQPIIKSGKDYQYVSGCNLNSEIGKMYGTFEMENLHNKTVFITEIPVFTLVAPYKLN